MGEWRKVETVVHETGSGIEDRKETTYEFGAEIDGVFVAYGTKSAGYVEHLRDLAKAQQDEAQAAAASDESGTASTATS